MLLQVIPGRFAVCKLTDASQARLSDDFWFLSKTDEEISLVCRSESIPGSCLCVEDDWRMLRVKGTLDFSLVGILAELSGILARAKVSLFAVSTYDTDYILVQESQFPEALNVLRETGHSIQ